MLDAAALVESSVDLSTDPAADRLVRIGSRSLRQVLEPLRLCCPDHPKWPETPINISQQEFDDAYDHLQQSGLPMKPDKNVAWTTFAQHRVQYECSLMTLVRLKKPPRGARWTTDRDETQQPLAIPWPARHLSRATQAEGEGRPLNPPPSPAGPEPGAGNRRCRSQAKPRCLPACPRR